MRLNRFYIAGLIFFFIIINTVYSKVQENFEFSFKVKNNTNKKSFILLELPSDVRKVGLEYRNITNPILLIDLLGENYSRINEIKKRVAVRYSENQTIVSHMNGEDKYDCFYDGDGGFLSGACFRAAKLILPPNLEVTVFQNRALVYSRADLKEILQTYLPYLKKVPSPDDNITMNCIR